MPPVYINGNADAYYRSIATLQSNQLRCLAKDSINAYVQFFEGHIGVSTTIIVLSVVPAMH